MNVTAIADLHGYLPEVAPTDLLLIAGDVCPYTPDDHFRAWRDRLPRMSRDRGVHDVAYQAHWLDTTFRSWLASVPARHIVGVAGNHDFVFERAPGSVPSLPWTYLQDDGCTVEGVKIYGSPWQPRFFDWAFNADPPELERYWSWIPDATEILVLHAPPYGYGDLAPDGRHAGCAYLRQRIGELPRLRLAVFGHIHEGRGRWDVDGKTLANVTLRDGQYGIVHEPMTFTV